MTEAIVTSALAPLMKEPSPRAEMVSQMLTGETGVIVEERLPWVHLRRALDGYPGWIHRGYLRLVSPEESAGWRRRARFAADGAEVEIAEGRRLALPLLARVAPQGDEWELASGARGRLVGGALPSADALARSASATRPVDWARARFAGSAYLWGGISPWGVDCSGLVQTTFAARGQVLPRDSQDQAAEGTAVDPRAIQPGDLLFFSENESRVTHVAFAGDDETLVHSTLACGGFVEESWRPGTRAAFLKNLLVAVRRIGS